MGIATIKKGIIKIKDIYWKLLPKVLNKYYINRVKVTDNLINPCFSPGKILYNHSYFVQNLIYKDNTWNYIIFLNKLFEAVKKGEKLSILDNHCENTKINYLENDTIRVLSNNINDDWIYLYLKEQLPDKYLLHFKICIHTVFTEVQIAFKHKSITDRIRFRVVDNKFLTFEVVKHGFFFNCLKQTAFGFEIGIIYDIKVRIYKNEYSFLVDDKPIMIVCDKTNNVSGGGMALIFWDEVDKSNINVNLKDINLYIE